MVYEVEDEVDWSDGSLSPSLPPAEDADAATQAEQTASLFVEQEDFVPSIRTKQTDSLPGFNTEAHEQWDLPFGEPLPSRSSNTHTSSKCGLSRAQRVKIGVQFNRREPTKEDYSHFALYQASQKTYEAVFLKDFLSHALHPRQLEACFGGDHHDQEHVEQYLRSVMTNVNQIVTKMIWNAHSRTINLLANDGKGSAHFWNFRRYKHSFGDFSPNNTFPVVHELNESWHRAFSPPQMVRYATKDYPVGTHVSPVEEIDDIAEALFRNRKLDDTLSTGRAVKPPSKKSKNRNLRTDALRAERDSDSRGDWMHDLVASSAPKISRPGHQNEPSSSANALRASHHEFQVDTVDGVDDDELPIQGQIATTMNGDIRTTTLGGLCSDSRKDSPHGEGSTQLEMRVHCYGPNVLLDASAATEKEEASSLQALKAVEARERLIADHKRRLSERWPAQQKRGRNLTLKTIIRQAVDHGILKPHTLEVQEKIDIATRVQSRNRKASALLCKKAETNNSPRKKRKTTHDSQASPASDYDMVNDFPLHSSGSKTLEPDQMLPPRAYFEPTSAEEKPAWRCGIKHAMGHYYNAGDRANCLGCFTDRLENRKTRDMDFYLPSKEYFLQPAPEITWLPSKETGKPRRVKTLSHNSRAKIAFYAALHAGATKIEARQKGVEAVEEHLRPKGPKSPSKKPRRPTPEPSPEPIDLGPHPSGSKTMEHDQDIPECAYREALEEGDQLAWRCDVNHALGRYYLAGNKKQCPGCGSAKNGKGKRAEMDFYLPSGVAIRQNAPGLSKWQPRKPYKINRTKKQAQSAKHAVFTHNQLCSKKYWAAIDDGQKHDAAMAFAVEQTDADLDAKYEAIQDAIQKKHAKAQAPKKAEKSMEDDSQQDKDVSEKAHSSAESPDKPDNSPERKKIQRLPVKSAKKRSCDEMDDVESDKEDEEMDDVESDSDSEDDDDEVESEHDTEHQAADAISISTEDDYTSSSDSE